MNASDDIQRAERIETYVSGKLQGTERLHFEEELARDASLREAVEMERLLRDTVRNEDVMRFRDRVREVTREQEALSGEEDSTPVLGIQRSRTWAYMAAAASVAVLVVATTIWLSRSPSYSELAMSYAQDSRWSVRGDEAGSINSDEDLLDRARKQIADKHAAEAMSLIEHRTFAAPCTEARRVWLMALAHLMLEQREQAAAELRTVAGSGCMLKMPAKELLEKL